MLEWPRKLAVIAALWLASGCAAHQIGPSAEKSAAHQTGPSAEKSAAQITCELTGDCADVEAGQNEGATRGFSIRRPGKTKHLIEAQNFDDLNLADNTTFLPWPPPRPTSMGELLSASNAETIGDISKIISAKMLHNGYYNLHYFAIPDGVGIVTELEHIGPIPVSLAGRWSSRPSQITGFRDYLTRLFIGDKGNYYLGVILITSQPVEPSTRFATSENLDNWRTTGEFVLSRPRADRHVSQRTKVWLLNYEFKLQHGATRKLVADPEGIDTFEQHRQRLGLQ